MCTCKKSWPETAVGSSMKSRLMQPPLREGTGREKRRPAGRRCSALTRWHVGQVRTYSVTAAGKRAVTAGVDSMLRVPCRCRLCVASALQVSTLCSSYARPTSKNPVLRKRPCRCWPCVAHALQLSTLCCTYPAGVDCVVRALQLSTLCCACLAGVDSVLRACRCRHRVVCRCCHSVDCRSAASLSHGGTGSVDFDSGDHASDDSVTLLS